MLKLIEVEWLSFGIVVVERKKNSHPRHPKKNHSTPWYFMLESSAKDVKLSCIRLE